MMHGQGQVDPKSAACGYSWSKLGHDCKCIHESCISGQRELMLLEKLSVFTRFVL